MTKSKSFFPRFKPPLWTVLILLAAGSLASAQVDFIVTQTESADPVLAGSGPSNLVFVVSVTNQGPSNATGLSLTNQLDLPAGVTVENILPSGTGSFAGGAWTVGDLPVGTVETLTLTLTVGAAAPPGSRVITNTVSVLSAGELIVNSEDDASSETTSISTRFLLTASLGGVRNNFNGFVGMAVAVGPQPLRVTHLGRVFTIANSGTHTLKFVDAATESDVPNSTVTLTMAPGTMGEFQYVALDPPVFLQSNATYYVVSQEANAADLWHDNDTSVTTPPDATVIGSVFMGSGFPWTVADNTTNRPYVPLNFRYVPLDPSANLPPVVNDDTVQGVVDTTFCIATTNLLSNDVDPNGDPMTVTMVETNSAEGASVSLLGDVITYIPPMGFSGTDSFKYTVSDGLDGSSTGTVTVEVDPPGFEVVGLPLSTNFQTGLYEQTIRVTNPMTNAPCGTLPAVRVLVSGLPAGAAVVNALGQTTNGAWIVLNNTPLDPGQSVELLLEYYLLDRETLPTPVITTEVVPQEPPPPDPEGMVLVIDRKEFVDGRLLIEFASIPGRTYAVQYADSPSPPSWTTSLPFINAVATRVQWVDEGPPKTESKPAEVTQRFYRVILLPAQ